MGTNVEMNEINNLADEGTNVSRKQFCIQDSVIVDVGSQQEGGFRA